ncbi:rhomboid family intramembrane serine protease [Iodidimonas sp. SYSU 1G8]|uniref:rhomboid family intramembrane serine protease n=1 Tax=Iodidimonas sp. SYSU 1G8 TaxID=3133967 RepID=UPI0031FE52B9
MMDLVKVRACMSVADADQHALVLTALGIPSFVISEDDRIGLYTSPETEAEARRQLGAYDEEERRRQRARRPFRSRLPRLEGLLAVWALMLFFFSVDTWGVFGTGWTAHGAAQAGAIVSGEWWRAVTALFLHADASHILGNMVLGSAVGVLVTMVLGSGAGWFAILVAGALGNGVNALINPAAHASIGASTAVFAALGILAGFNQVSSALAWHRGLRRWGPVAAGAALLVFLGTAGERTDVSAHVAGFFVGALVGLIAGRYGQTLIARRRVQIWCGVAAVSLVVLAWTLAMTA